MESVIGITPESVIGITGMRSNRFFSLFLVDRGSISHVAPSSSESRARTSVGTAAVVAANTVVVAQMG